MADKPPLTAADMLTHLHELGDQGSDYNDHLDGWFGWKIDDAGTGAGTLTVHFEPATEEGSAGPRQSMQWTLVPGTDNPDHKALASPEQGGLTPHER